MSGVIIATVLGVTGLVDGVANADAPTEQGWWWTANPGDPAPPPPTPPDVPPGGLLLQSGAQPTSPVAYAALVYATAPGATVVSLRLRVAALLSGGQPDAVPGARLQLCPLTRVDIAAEQGGPMSHAPGYTCDRRDATGPSSDGTSYTFDNVSTLTTAGFFAVAILPDPSSNVDRVVLSSPDASALAIKNAGPTAPIGGDTTPSTLAGSPAVAASEATPLPSLAVPAGLGLAAVSTPPPDAPAPSGGPASTPSGISPTVSPRFPVAATTGSGAAKGWAVALVVLVVLLGGAGWLNAGNVAIRAAAHMIASDRAQRAKPQERVT